MDVCGGADKFVVVKREEENRHPGPPTSEGRVKEIEGSQVFQNGGGGGVLCIGTSWQASGRAGGRKRGKLEEQKGGRNDTLKCRNHSHPQAGVHRTIPGAPQRWLPLQGSGILQHSGHPRHPLPMLLQQPPATALGSGVYSPSSSCLLFQRCCPLAGSQTKKGGL